MGKTKNIELATMESMADLWEKDLRNQTNAYERVNDAFNINLEEAVTLGRHAILNGDADTSKIFVDFRKIVGNGKMEES